MNLQMQEQINNTIIKLVCIRKLLFPVKIYTRHAEKSQPVISSKDISVYIRKFSVFAEKNKLIQCVCGKE